MINYFKKISFKQILFFLVCVLVVEFLLLKQTPFFWDGISKSSRATWIYANGLTEFIVPTDHNSGHPPLWIALLAVFWTIFQKALWSSRLLLLIVNIGVVWQIVLFCKTNFLKTVSAFAVLVVCLEPTFVAQTTNLNNDMLLLFFTLLSLNALIKTKSVLFSLALTGLLFINLRGIYIVIAIVLIHVVYSRLKLIENERSIYLAYGIALLSFVVFCYFQYEKLGWFLITQKENYNMQRQSVGVKQVLINSIVYVKSFLEYGRFIVALFLLPLLVRYIKNKTNRSIKIDRIAIAFFVFAFIFFIGMVPFSNPIGDRYFMICYLLAIILLINLIAHYNLVNKSLIYSIIVLMFVSGHFWIYPATISQSWDSSLAYLNSYTVEDQMEDYIDSVGIKTSEIGTRVRFNERNFSEFKVITETDRYADFNLATNKFILLSNIDNQTKDDELNEIMNNWKLVKRYSQLGVFMSLYERE
ncbi:glycosyltransferase family 39 protein [Winogradskyella thalassocola]|uniref:Dolichyl-phosphate-mannose-protein mannosyltransferase n=1 Tax=Winogradskyella thalassocola TaxID=262004 RepID=A0A1G8DHF6_9FLAO|nr:glycosyltransferase family 39 protein [Winogradskyella thalassocola]SDH56899.1 Dolichyl-phosphate-mannose-protein mannosyltransferase [Winogradskyella thalassocola]